MIDPATFWTVWERICKRFNRQADRDMAMEYLAYLEAAGLETQEAHQAGLAIWAVNEFFPRPADFLSTQAALGWSAVLEWAERWNPHMDGSEARALIAAIPPRAMAAVRALGGLDVLRENRRDLLRTREAFFDAFQQRVVEEAARAGQPEQLEHGEGARALPGAARQLGSGAELRFAMKADGPQRVSVEVR